MRKLFFIFAVVANLFARAGDYSNVVLQMHANILPKLVLMDLKFKEKLIDSKLVITILYNNGDKFVAKKLKDFIHEKYPNGIKNIEIDIRLVQYDEFIDKRDKSTLVYLLDSFENRVIKIIDLAKELKVITFANDKSYLNFGVNMSLDIDKKVRPFINLKAMKENNISPRPTLLKISKLYE